MSNPWSREHAESAGTRFDDAVEVPLDEAGISSPEPSEPRGVRTRPTSTQLALVAIVASVAAVTALMLLRSDDAADDAGDDRSSTATTIDPFLLADSVTTPPTLTPIDRPAAVEPASSAPSHGPVPDVFVSAPEFEQVPGVAAGDLPQYDLAAAVDRNAPGGDPMRAMFRIRGPLDDLGETDPQILEGSLSIVAASDPANQRDALTVEFGESSSTTLADRTTGTVYTSSVALPEDVWAEFPASAVLADSGAADLGQFFDAMVTGPITSDVLEVAQVTASDGLVRLDGGLIARRYDVEVAVDAIRPAGALMFAGEPGSVSDIDGGETISFQVYVTSQPAMALVTSNFEVNGEPRAFTQMFDRRPANVRIELPSEDQVVSSRRPNIGSSPPVAP